MQQYCIFDDDDDDLFASSPEYYVQQNAIQRLHKHVHSKTTGRFSEDSRESYYNEDYSLIVIFLKV